jgi:hypothetical protein
LNTVSNWWRYWNSTFFCVVANNANNFFAEWASTPRIFPCCGPQHGKIIGVVGNNAEKFRRCRKQCGNFYPIVGNNVKNVLRCGQQRGLIFKNKDINLRCGIQ